MHAVLLDPLDLIARLVALIPPPRFHMLRYHGVLAAHAKARAEVVPGHAASSPSEPVQPGLDDVVLVVGHPSVAPHAPTHVVDLPDPESAAHLLYTVLRACDARDARRILVLMPPDVPAWQAVRDRLWRATVPG